MILVHKWLIKLFIPIFTLLLSGCLIDKLPENDDSNPVIQVSRIQIRPVEDGPLSWPLDEDTPSEIPLNRSLVAFMGTASDPQSGIRELSIQVKLTVVCAFGDSRGLTSKFKTELVEIIPPVTEPVNPEGKKWSSWPIFDVLPIRRTDDFPRAMIDEACESFELFGFVGTVEASAFNHKGGRTSVSLPIFAGGCAPGSEPESCELELKVPPSANVPPVIRLSDDEVDSFTECDQEIKEICVHHIESNVDFCPPLSSGTYSSKTLTSNQHVVTGQINGEQISVRNYCDGDVMITPKCEGDKINLASTDPLERTDVCDAGIDIFCRDGLRIPNYRGRVLVTSIEAGGCR